jgi:N-acetylglutamate synthase-like GNAT family acetyltransferase
MSDNSAVRIHLRPATAADAPAIRSLIHRVQINPWGLDWHHFLVAVDGSDALVGCGQLKPHGRSIVELASIAVEQDYRDRGIARRIIDALIAQAPRPLFLTCRSSLGPLYAKWGFREMSLPEMPRYFQRLAGLTSLLSKLARMDERLLVMVLK